MRFAYRLEGVRDGSRLRKFRDLLAASPNYVSDAVDYHYRDDNFQLKGIGWQFAKMSLAEMECTSLLVERTPEQARRAPEESLLIGIGLECLFTMTQDGRETVVKQGDSVLFTKSRPYELAARELSKGLYLQVPKRELVDRFGPIDDLTAIALSSSLPVHRLMTNFFMGLSKVMEQIDVVTAERLVAQGLDLLALAMATRAGQSLTNTTVHRSASISRLKSLIISRLKEPSFSLADAAAAFGVSPRYINSLLATQNTSFGRFVLEKRLLACQRDLADPRHFSTNIIDIAFRWGFNDPAHFSRSFKARFGHSPRDFQRQCLVQHRGDAIAPLLA